MKDNTPADILAAGAETFRQRDKLYGANYLKVESVLRALLPEGVPLHLQLSNRFYLFSLIAAKLSRFANSGMTHQDSIHDIAVYAAMLESILPRPAPPASYPASYPACFSPSGCIKDDGVCKRAGECCAPVARPRPHPFDDEPQL